MEHDGCTNDKLQDVSTGWTLAAASASTSGLFLTKQSNFVEQTHHEYEHILLTWTEADLTFTINILLNRI